MMCSLPSMLSAVKCIDHIEVEYIEFVSGNLQINVETGEISYEGQEKEETGPEPPKPSGAA